MSPHRQRSLRPRSLRGCAPALLALLVACDDGEAVIAADGEVPDAQIAEADAALSPDLGVDEPLRCEEVVLAAGDLRLVRCSDGVHHNLMRGDTALCLGLGASVRLPGAAYALSDYPQILWRPGEAGVTEGRISGRPGAPVLTWRLTLTAQGLAAQLDATFEAAGRLIQLQPLDLAPWGGCAPGGEAPTWRVAAQGGAAPAPVDEAPPQRDRIALRGPERAFLLVADPPSQLQPAGGAIFTASAPEISAGPPRLQWAASPTDPPREVTAGATVSSATWWLASAPDAVALGALWADRIDRGLGGEPPTFPLWGWTTSGAYGALMNGATLAAERLALDDVRHDGRPTVTLDGQWYVGLGQWWPHDALAADLATLSADLDADLALDWPLLQVSDEADLLQRQPGWRLLDGEGASTPCGQSSAACGLIDPRLPQVRDALLESALAWPGAVTLAHLSGLGPALAADPQSLTDLLTALDRPDTPTLSLPLAYAWPTLYAPRLIALSGPPRADLGAACLEADREQLGARSATCEAALRDLTPAAAEAPDAAWGARPRALAHQLALLWPLGAGGHALDPGPIFTGPQDQPGLARQGAAVALLAGGPWRLGDSPLALSGRRLDLYAAPLEAGLTGGGVARPLPDKITNEDADHPPAVWRQPGRFVVIFNWTGAALSVDDARRWIDWPGAVVDLFGGEMWPSAAAVGALVLPPDDVVVLTSPLE